MLLARFPKLVNKVPSYLPFLEFFLLISFLDFSRLRLLIEVIEYDSFEYNYFWNYTSFIACGNCERICKCVCLPI